MIIELSVKQTDLKSGKISNSKAFITDALSLTRFNDREQGMRVYIMMKQLGRIVTFDKAVIKEVHTGMTAKEIADKMERENQAVFDELNKKNAGRMKLEQNRKEVKNVI